jgi:pimeloyl-ACP methyl ester carboxylesterase
MTGEGNEMTPSIAKVNGIGIAYRVEGTGPPLVLVMGYRLSSLAWPAAFVEALASQFMVITMDNRGTGRSDKPVQGYALANMARDVCGLLDELEIPRAHLLGYSMGGAIAQEFVRQFPKRVLSLILCASMCGGAEATYASAPVVRVMRDLDGLSPEQVARQIWKVTYAPNYLMQNQQIVEEQMRREIALPTPLHAADLQFQAFAEFDGSKSLPEIRCPTLVLTGDLDHLIPPLNSIMMAKRIPGAKLIVLPGGGHRVLWERTGECSNHISGFLASADPESVATAAAEGHHVPGPKASDAFSPLLEMFTTWPLAMTRAGFESLTKARHSMMVGSASRFGDGKPVILVTPWLGSELALHPLSLWLKAIGYRPVTAGLPVNFEDTASLHSLSNAIRETTKRVGRKAVLITHSVGMTQALRTAEAHDRWISDVVVLDAVHRPRTKGPRTHFISTGWFVLQSIFELPRILRGISIELLGKPDTNPGLGQVEFTAEEHSP